MRRLFLFGLFAAGVLSVGCNKQEVIPVEEPVGSGGSTGTVRVWMEGGTKVDIDGTVGSASWSEGDQIAYCVTNGSLSGYNVSTVDVESGEISVTVPDGYWRWNYAVYPATARGTDFTAPTVVYASSYDIAGKDAETYCPCPMIARNTSSDLSFYHVGGIVRLKVDDIPSGTRTLQVAFPGISNVVGTFSVSRAGTVSAACSVVTGGGNVVSFTNGGADFGTSTYLNVPVPAVDMSGLTDISVRCMNASGVVIRVMAKTLTWSASVRSKGRLASVSSRNSRFVFRVSASKYVSFAPGNLQAHIASGPDANSVYIADAWRFAEHQYDYCNTTLAVGNWHDMFGWVGASASYDSYGLSTISSTNNAIYGTDASDALKTDWGEIPGVVSSLGAGWRTLTNAEHGYLFNSRATGATVNGTSNARYTQATVNTDGTPVNGVMLFPDGYAGGTPSGVTWGTVNAASAWGTKCTVAGWKALEAAGCVFLPAAGYRSGSGMLNVVTDGDYWSRSVYSVDNAYHVTFNSGYVNAQYSNNRRYGFSVRLSRES